MQRNFTQANQITSRATKLVRRFALGFGFALAASSLLFVSAEANAQGSAYFGRSLGNAAQSFQQHAANQINSVRQIADS